MMLGVKKAFLKLVGLKLLFSRASYGGGARFE